MSNINRQNYETFFLLYTDNELSVAERKAVDEFVLMNPDLMEELIMLQQSILKPDNIVFDNKSSLLKNSSLPAGIAEKLLLHLDNELPKTEKKELVKSIHSNEAIEREWNILQKTKLLPESIVFADKKSLYRKEGSRLVSLRVWKYAAAAVLIGFGVWGGLAYLNNQPAMPANEIVKKPVTRQVPATVQPTTDQLPVPVINSSVVEREIAVAKTIAKKSPALIASKPDQKIVARKLPKEDIATSKEKALNNNLPEPYFENVNNIDRNNTITTNVTPKKQSSNIVDPRNNDIVNSAGKLDPANSFAANTSFTNNKEDNSDRVLFMNEEKFKKTKIGGIFRKVKRVLERTANIKQDGNNNNIKVANLEFAIQ